MSVIIDNQEKELTLLFQKATGERLEQKALGLTGSVNGFPVGFYPTRSEDPQGVVLVVMDLKTGAMLKRVELDLVQFLLADTKEKGLDLQLKALEVFADWFIPDKIQIALERRAALPEVKQPVVVEDWKAYAKEKRNAE